MSVLIETSVGEIVVDLYTDKVPNTCDNFLKLCKMKHYNNTIFWNVDKDFVIQGGDPEGNGSPGVSAWYKLHQTHPSHPKARSSKYIDDEFHPQLKHNKIGLLCMNNTRSNENGSAFYFTLRNSIPYLDDKHTIFGEVVEEDSFKTLAKINNAFCDAEKRPYQNIRVLHTIVLDDPFEEVEHVASYTYPDSPIMKADKFDEGRLKADDMWLDEFASMDANEIKKVLKQKETERRASVLTLLGDIPDIHAAPPENVAFICKLNPVTEKEDLETIFRTCGHVKSCYLVKDKVTKTSLGYGFVEMASARECEEAVKKLNNSIIDDRRVRVDFSQSVSTVWKEMQKGERKLGQASSSSWSGSGAGSGGSVQNMHIPTSGVLLHGMKGVNLNRNNRTRDTDTTHSSSSSSSSSSLSSSRDREYSSRNK